jgi:DNA-binding NtrC family response regulator
VRSMHFDISQIQSTGRTVRLSGATSQKTILLVEDDTVVLQVLRDVLRRLGHRVFTAKNVSEAEETWAKARAGIDVVVCDHVLGHDRGADLVQRFKTHRPEVKMVLCSGATTRLDVPGIRFLPKPFSVSLLVDAMS